MNKEKGLSSKIEEDLATEEELNKMASEILKEIKENQAKEVKTEKTKESGDISGEELLEDVRKKIKELKAIEEKILAEEEEIIEAQRQMAEEIKNTAGGEKDYYEIAEAKEKKLKEWGLYKEPTKGQNNQSK